MFCSRISSKIRPLNRYIYPTLNCIRSGSNSSKTTDKNEPQKTVGDQTKLGEFTSKYQVFRDQDSDVILDLYEERNKYGELLDNGDGGEVQEDPFEGLNLERGLTGVYDIEDLVEVLKRENAEDICVISVPKQIDYVDYICIVNGKSFRHMQAIGQFVRRVYKKKMYENDIIPKLEGENSKDWMAIDLGNIALHIFSKNARSLYDLDTLWSVGPQYDPEFNKKDPIADMLEKHSLYLKDLEPAS